jgi:peptidyl-prolyl cis-trans isomerase C
MPDFADNNIMYIFLEGWMKKLLILIVSAIIISGCAQKEEGGKDFLAKVNSKTITKEDFNNKLNTLPEWARGRFKSVEGQKEFLDEIIKEELLYQEAINRNVDKEVEIMEKIEEFKRMTMISTLLKREIEAKTSLKENEAKEFYEKHKDNFMTGLEVKAQHILVDTKEEADDLLKKIMKNESFSELAKNFSKDKGTAMKGGDLGYFSTGRMVPEFEKTAFSLKVGEISEPVKSQFGYHIIKVNDKKEGKLREFEEVKATIEKRLSMDKQKTIFETYVNNLKEKAANIDINEEVLGEMAKEQTPSILQQNPVHGTPE